MKTVEKRVNSAGVDNNPLNRDPLSGKPGAHPVGTGVGAAGGGAAGAAIGTAVAGPVGTVVGAVVGTLGGGLAGKAAGEAINPTAATVETVAPTGVDIESTSDYWRTQFDKEPYYQSMVFRLMVAGGSAVGPRKITVITTTDRVDTRGMPFREIVTERPFTSYEDAQRAASAASALQATIVGLDPRESPFPLDALTSLARVHDVRQLGQQSSDPWARIFQVGAQGR